MPVTSNERLSDPRVKAYLLSLFASDLPAGEKYARLQAIMQSRDEVQDETLETPPPASAAGLRLPAGVDVDLVVSEVQDSIRRALRRLRQSQHQDGGWGPSVETSRVWDSAQAVLCLSAARAAQGLDLEFPIDLILRQGCLYLELAADEWAADALAAEGALPVYDLSAAAACLFGGAREFFRRDTSVRIYRSFDHLYRAQNEDGGWDACLWGYAVATPTRVFSEVGATAAAIQSLAQVYDGRFEPAIEKASLWLAAAQNIDGSWNNGSCRPDWPSLTLTGDPRPTKTCDALRGILTAQALHLTLDSSRLVLDRGIDWLLRRLQPILARPTHPKGWAWGYTPEDYETVCLALETLLLLPTAPVEVLTALARWLVQGQHNAPGEVVDGDWALGDTARITTALIAYHNHARALARSVSAYQNYLP